MICGKRRKEGVCPRKRARNPPSHPPKAARRPPENQPRPRREVNRKQTASKTASRGAKTPAKSPSPKPASRPNRRTGRLETARQPKRRTSRHRNSYKIQSIGSAQAGLRNRTGRGRDGPAFNLPRDGGGTVSLADYAGKKLVLFFYPRADTPGCTRRPSTSRGSTTRLPTEEPRYWASRRHRKSPGILPHKHQLSVPLISDEQHEMLRPMAPGAKNRCMAGTSWESFDDGSDRRRWADRQNLAQCAGRRPCRRGAGRGPRHMTWRAITGGSIFQKLTMKGSNRHAN